MSGHKEAPELVFRGRVGVWYQAVCVAIAVVAAILALQTTLPVFVPVLALVVGAVLLVPLVVAVWRRSRAAPASSRVTCAPPSSAASSLRRPRTATWPSA